MATRTIVTSQPDVACDVCARRLLRGEQPDVFVGAGRRRIVCELCAPRAAHEGWLRETDTPSLTLAPARPRRAGGLFERLRRVTQPVLDSAPAVTPDASADLLSAASAQAAVGTSAASSPEGELVRAPQPAPVQAPAETVLEVSGASSPEGEMPMQAPEPPRSETGNAYEEPSAYLRQAIEVFNASEFPRRVAGVIRSLGVPLVTVRSAEHLASVVRIVVAWELCWYCYEVDLSEPVAEAQVIAQGTELAELAREDRAGNAAASDSGALLLAGGA